MSRPIVKLVIGMLLICALAAVTGCADRNTEWLGGLGFDLAAAALQGLAGN